jgi:hypothetical protein
LTYTKTPRCQPFPVGLLLYIILIFFLFKMSQIGEAYTAQGSGKSKKYRIDQDAQKVMIVRTTRYILRGMILSTLTERVSLEIQGLGSSRVSQGERIPLGKMAAFAQFGEGVIAESVAQDGTVKQYIPVVLASVGVGLAAGDNFSLLIENMLDGATYEVFAIQTPTTGNMVYEYLEQSVLAGDKHRKIDVQTTRCAVLPKAGLQKLVVTYNGGRTCEYLPVELAFINAENNDVEVLTRTDVDPGNNEYTSSVTGSMSSEAIILKTDLLSQIEVFTDGNLYEYVTIGEIDRNAR